MNGVCPMCGETVRLKSTAKKGDIVFCEKCDAELEIVNLNPVELDWPLDDYNDEDFYDDDDYFEDDDY